MLDKEDYEKSRCPFDCNKWKKITVASIPTHRIIEKLDAYLDAEDYASAERHLKYWEREAEAGNDGRGLLVLYNELMGLYRKTGRKADALTYAEKAVNAVWNLKLNDRFSGGNTYLNAATVYKAFGQTQKALALFERAKPVYEKLDKNDDRKCGLYNNYGLALTDAGRYGEAVDLFQKAINVHKRNAPTPDAAIAYLNLADTYFLMNGQRINADTEKCLANAKRVLNDTASPNDGYYAYVCEKCAPVFEGYGEIDFAKELTERRKRRHERS